MILVTGASGKTGRAVLAALSLADMQTRALVWRQTQIEGVANLGARQVMVGDMRLEPDIRRALKHARLVYHICPNMSPDEVEIGRTLIAAAREANVEHLALHSVLHPQTEGMPHHWNKLRVEEMLIKSGLNFTVLQPAAYMQNLLPGWQRITQDGVLCNPYPVATRLSLVDLRDVAEVAVKVLAETGHNGATYELAGTPPLAQTEVAALISDALGRPVRAEAEPIEAWEQRVRSAGLGDYQRLTLVKMFQYYARYGLPGNPGVLRWLLGREPASLVEFARRAAADEELR
jgi:NAD(P)H dehydrogenase (quinone)